MKKKTSLQNYQLMCQKHLNICGTQQLNSEAACLIMLLCCLHNHSFQHLHIIIPNFSLNSFINKWILGKNEAHLKLRFQKAKLSLFQPMISSFQFGSATQNSAI